MIEATNTFAYTSGGTLKNSPWYNALTLKERLASLPDESQEE